MDPDAFSGHVILEGPPASGVTKLAEKCAHSLDRRRKIFRKLFDCKTLNSKNLESVTKAFGRVFEECFVNEPSILILDDLDQLCAAPSSSKQLTPGAEMHFVRLAKVLIKFLDCIKYERMKCLCIATCKSKSKIHRSLVSSQGRRYFTKCFQVPVLNEADRLEFFEQIVRLKNFKFENRSILEKLVEKSRGCVIGDLVHVIEKISTTKLNQNPEKRGKIDLIDVNSALKDFKSINLHQIDESTLQNWDDFGGYQSLKFDLEKIFLWPSKYTQIYEKLNIKSTDGVLLYGPTGTGKTVLASLTAKMCSLNCIVVKSNQVLIWVIFTGAELLSKYIGASEEAVRNTFHRARSVRPSMILFDEFDALAPRRGHDSTGVTDRVVNQLLTELDGVEPLDGENPKIKLMNVEFYGVYIIATSSRPDLIDPAFLRPGRIGHHFYCALPTTEERIQILHSLSKNLKFDSKKNENLTYLGAKTVGFSGADLKSILFTAQMLALYAAKDDRKMEKCRIKDSNSDDLIKCFPEKDSSTIGNLFLKFNRFERQTIKEESENRKTPEIRLEITKQNLEESLSTIKPSVTQSDIMRFEYIRKMLESKFENSSQGSIIDEKMIGSRATLA
uniref:AAA+ ATPase domain-containing protein n=1 Tax=Romanomermis culicivorax TaxID=13658 RepID=A0A915JUY0_ROMCU